MNDTAILVGQRLAAYLQRSKITHVAFARRSGIHQQAVRFTLDGRTTSKIMQRKIAATMGITFEELTGAPPAAGPVPRRDWQAVLGLQVLLLPTADDVQQAYRRLASKYHPDRETGDVAAMAAINVARDQALGEINR